MKKSILLWTISLSFGSAFAEQIPGTDIEVFGESANIGAVGRTVTLRHLPVRNISTNELNYYDISFSLGLDANREVVFEKLDQVNVTPVHITTAQFRAGIYRDTRGNEYRLSGPSISPAGFEVYNLLQVAQGQNSQLEGLRLNISTQPAAEQFVQSPNYRNAKETGDLAESNGHVFGRFDYDADPAYEWEDPGTADWVSGRVIDDDLVEFTTWDVSQAENTNTLTLINPD